MKIIGKRLRSLRESVRLSQAKLAKEFDVSQSALARYEIDDSTPSPEVFLKYADYFDVSLDYIFGRTDDPHGMIYNNCVKLGLNNPEMARFVEMCFDPGSAMNERLKATLVQMLSEVDVQCHAKHFIPTLVPPRHLPGQMAPVNFHIRCQQTAGVWNKGAVSGVVIPLRVYKKAICSDHIEDEQTVSGVIIVLDCVFVLCDKVIIRQQRMAELLKTWGR